MSLNAIGELAGAVLEKIQGRGPMSRWARRMQKHSRRNWRQNGLRPRGRGYDWARTLIAEKILELATLGSLEEEEAAPASVAVEVKMAELAGSVPCHVRIARREVARLESMGCLRRAQTAGGRGRPAVLHVYHTALAARVLGRLHRYRGPQLALPLKGVVEVEVPAEIQAIVDRIAAAAAKRREQNESSARMGQYSGRTVQAANLEMGAPQAALSRVPAHGEDLAKPVDNSAEKNLRGNEDPSSPLTPYQPRRNTPSALAVASGEGGLRRRETKFAKIVQRPDLKTLKLDWAGVDECDRASKEVLSEPLRRRLNRHLRLCAWYRGLGLVETRRLMGAVGWTAGSIGKASKRKYFLMDAIGWVMSSKPDDLRQATASWNRMLGRAHSGFAHGTATQLKKSL